MPRTRKKVARREPQTTPGGFPILNVDPDWVGFGSRDVERAAVGDMNLWEQQLYAEVREDTRVGGAGL